MLIQNSLTRILRIPRNREINQGEPEIDSHLLRNVFTQDNPQSPKIDRKNSGTKPFISQSTDKCLPFYKLLKGNQNLTRRKM